MVTGEDLTLGRRIRLLRAVRCLTQEQLAECVGVSQQAISVWEKEQAFPAYRHRKALADALETDVRVLFDGLAA